MSADADSGHSEASVAIDGAGQPVQAVVRGDPLMAIVLVVLVALGVVGLALWVVRIAIKSGR